MTKLIERFPGYALALILTYVAVTGAVAAYRWIYSAYSEAKKGYLERLSQYCAEVSDIAGQIAASEYYPKEAIGKFLVYYYGKLILVEDENLEAAMVALGDVLDGTTPQNYAERRFDVEDAALNVSGACRDLIKGSWYLAIAPWRDLQAKKTGQKQDRKKEQDRIESDPNRK